MFSQVICAANICPMSRLTARAPDEAVEGDGDAELHCNWVTIAAGSSGGGSS